MSPSHSNHSHPTPAHSHHHHGHTHPASHHTPLFSPSLLPQHVQAILPAGYVLRPLTRADYHAGFLDVLRVLTTVGDVSESAWNSRYDWISARPGEYFILCIEETASKKIVAVGSLIVEKKFLRNCGEVGHIEDIAVSKAMQGKQFGLRIIQALDHISEKVGCYKTILDCSEKNEGFYVKCGFKKSGVQMVRYYPVADRAPTTITTSTLPTSKL